MTTESSLKLTEAVINVLRGGPKKFKELYPLLADRLPEECPHARHDGAYTVNLAEMTWLRDVATILETVAVNNAGLWRLKDMAQPEHPVIQEVKNTLDSVPLDQEPSLMPEPAMVESGPTPQKEQLNTPKERPTATDDRETFLEQGVDSSGMSLGEPRNESQRVSEEMLESIFLEGMRLNNEWYYEHCGKGQVKTFCLFCQKLSSNVGNPALPSTKLNEFIIEELRRGGVVVNKHFNPQGWFGKAWTDWNDSKNEKYFRYEYCEVLIRTGENPYFYQINPEYVGLVKKILDEIQGRV